MHDVKTEWKNDQILPVELVNSFSVLKKAVVYILESLRLNQGVIGIFRREFINISTDLAQTKSTVVGLRGTVGVPTKGSNMFSLTSEVEDLRDLERDRSNSYHNFELNNLRIGNEN